MQVSCKHIAGCSGIIRASAPSISGATPCKLGGLSLTSTSRLPSRPHTRPMEDGETTHLAEKIQDLDDLGLAALACLVAGEHCIVYAPSESLDHVADELDAVRAIPGRRSSRY
jgi:hypothetical protein